MDQQDETNDIIPPDSPHEKTPFPEEEPKDDAPSLPLRPPPQRPHSTLEIGSSSTLPLPRPLSTSIDTDTGEFIYDRLPETLPRPPKSSSQPTAAAPPPSTLPQVMEMPEKEQPKEKQVEIISNEGKEEKEDLPNSHKICTIISMILCGLILNVFAFICLIPAYFYSLKAKDKFIENDFEEGLKLAKRSLWLNIIAVVCTFVAVLVIFILIQVIFAATIY